MPGTLPPGIGTDAEATQATAFIRQQPWYQQWLASKGIAQGPNQQVKLNDQQRAELMALSMQNGVGLNTKYDSIDENGMIAEEHHKAKKVAIAAAIAGLALTGFGAAGIGPLAGALGGASAAGAGAGAGAAAAGGTAAAIPTTMGIASATALGLPVTAGLGTAGAIGAGAAGAATAGAYLAPEEFALTTTQGLGGFVPTTATGISAGTGGSSVGWLNTLKSAYDWYQKGSNVYDGVKGMTGPSPGQSLTQTAGNIEGGRLAALIKQAELQQQQDRLGLERTNAGVNVGNLDLGRRKFAQGVPGQLANDSVRGDVMAGAQDASFSGLPSYIHIPNISGGLRPSLFSGNTRSLGAKMSRDALASSMSGDLTKFPDLPSVPDATPLPEANGTDTALQWAAGAGGLLDTLGRFGTKNKSRPQVEPGYQGAGTPGYPGDGVSDPNPMIQPNGPQDQTAPDEWAGTTEMGPQILEWLKRNGQGAA